MSRVTRELIRHTNVNTEWQHYPKVNLNYAILNHSLQEPLTAPDYRHLYRRWACA
jgi:hypothetical protein